MKTKIEARLKDMRVFSVPLCVLGGLILGSSSAKAAGAKAAGAKAAGAKAAGAKAPVIRVPAAPKFLESSVGIPADDPFKGTDPFPIQGTLLYYYRRTFHKAVIVSRKYTGDKVEVASYIVESPKSNNYDTIYDLEGSSQGLISFKYGHASQDTSSYRLYILNPADKTVTDVAPSSPALSYKDYLWSPDGKFLAFLSGGDIVGRTYENGELNLNLYETAKHTSKLVVSNPYLSNTFAWSAPHSLFYAVPESAKSANGTSTQTTGKAVGTERPDLFLFDPIAGKSKLLFKDCYRPAISGDGRKVAFFGAEDTAKPPTLPPNWRSNPAYMTLCVANLDGTERRGIDTEKRAYPRLLWSSDNRSIFSVLQITPGPTAQMTFNIWDVTTGERRGTPSIKVTDQFSLEEFYRAEPINQPEYFKRFSILGRTGDKFIISCTQITGVDTDTMIINQNLLQALDVSSGTVTLLGSGEIFQFGLPMSWVSPKSDAAE